MIIRRMQEYDIPKAIIALEDYCVEMGWPFIHEHIKEKLVLMEANQTPIYVAVDDEENVLGMAAFWVIPHILNPNKIEAYEFIWHTSTHLTQYQRAKLMIELLDVMEDRTNKARIALHVSVSTTALTDFLERRGYKMKELHYAKEVSYGN